MQLFIALAAIIGICAGNAIPSVPGDNSHYVEGKSRYIWMPSSNGEPILVDLWERGDAEAITKGQRTGANNQYYLYTRQNPTTPQRLVFADVNSVFNSNFQSSRPTKVIVHGWQNDYTSEVNTLITSAFLEAEDVNVIVVDWNHVAGNILYWYCVTQVPSIGQHVGFFLTWLITITLGSYTNVHLVGHSLGAHVVGNAGRTLGGQVARVTGLDPAGPNFGGNANALTFSDGLYVEAIHTDGGALGIMDAIAAANFYPNGGRNPQPGCLISTCSHGRAYEFFAASVIYNNFLAQSCSSLTDASNNVCTGYTFRMGNSDLTKRGFGLFALTTGRTWPF